MMKPRVHEEPRTSYGSAEAVQRHIHDVCDDKKVIVGVDMGIGESRTVVSVWKIRGKSRKLKCTFVATEPRFVGKFIPGKTTAFLRLGQFAKELRDEAESTS
jgi:hypothetical protein